ncbi:MAG: colanic acid biosynthesis protein, partial [Marinirhabdus sp.]|nr:colanic acid biosynthesis protein [Marinirhabdus sp.]
MSKKRLHITIFDGSLKTTTFINRLIEGLSTHHEVYVFGFTENLQHAIPGVRYVALGSAAAKLRLMQLGVVFAFKALFTLGSLSLFLKSLALLIRFRKKALQQHHFNIAIALHRPDILHVQWPSLLPWCESALQDPAVRVVLSQRGYQNNVRPFLDEANKNYLAQV